MTRLRRRYASKSWIAVGMTQNAPLRVGLNMACDTRRHPAAEAGAGPVLEDHPRIAKNPRKITVQFDDMTDDAYAAFANGLWYLAGAAGWEGDFSVSVSSKDVPLLNKEWKRPSPEWKRH